MSRSQDSKEELQAEVQSLKLCLAEAEETLRAIRSGEVDALVVDTSEGEQLFTLAGAEQPYRLMIEMMNEGAAILALNGTIFYCNRCFSEMVQTPLEKMIGGSIYQFVRPSERKLFKKLVKHRLESGGRDEFVLQAADGNLVSILLSVSNFKSIDAAGALCLVATDISEHKQSDELLKKSEQELRIKTQSLEEVNAALKVLLDRVEDGRRELEEKILANIRELVLPYLDKLKKTILSEDQITCLTIAEANINHIASSFLHNLKAKYLNLTHREIQIATLVKEGKSIKDISGILNISPKTVEFHRNSLRTKLGLKNKKANLRSHLLTFL